MNARFRRLHPLTVMFIADQLDRNGGAERSMYLLAKGLKQRGHKVIVCCFQAGEFAEDMRRDGFRVEELGLKSLFSLEALRTFLELVRLVKRERVCVIVSYHESSDFVGLLTALFARVPIVSSRRDMGYRLKRRHISLYRVINRFFDRIAAVSSAVKNNVVRTQWSKPARIEVIYNGVVPVLSNESAPNHPGSPSAGQPGDSSFRVCCVANFRPIKGHMYLIDAAKMVAEQHAQARFVLVGDWANDEGYACYDQVRKRVEELGLTNVVEFIGEVLPQDLPPFLSRMDVSVLPSLSEGMSNTILESMAVAKPVVATSVGGNPEVVEHGRTGFLVRPSDPRAMAEALLEFLADPNLCREMGLRGRSRVESEFSVTRMVEKYEDLLQYVYLNRKVSWPLRSRRRLEKIVRLATSWGKVIVASIACRAGLVAAVRAIKRVLRLGKVKILCFHDVSLLAKRHPQVSSSVSPESFSRFVSYVARNYRVVSLGEAVALLEAGRPLASDILALTFDDCYKGWFDHVLPVCEHLGVPFTVFVSTRPLDSGVPLLYDALLFLAESTWRKVADLSQWGLGVFLLASPHDVASFVEKVHRFWRGRNKDDCNLFLQDVAKYLGVSLSPDKFRDVVLNWDEVCKMNACGVTIGSHTVDHTCLRDLRYSECFWQVSQGKRRLEEKLGHHVSFFSYPYGGSDSYSRDSARIVAETGFRNAFTLDARNGRRFQPLEILRHDVSYGVFHTPAGQFHEPLLAAELCGLADILFGRVFTRRKDSGCYASDSGRALAESVHSYPSPAMTSKHVPH